MRGTLNTRPYLNHRRLTYLSENGVAIVGQHDAAHGVEEHLEHGLGAQGGPHDIAHGLGSLDVCQLSILALLSLGVLVQNDDWRLHRLTFEFIY